jgi:curved DNA-binding protein CbpA
MPPRPLVPTDDLYARLELPVTASAEAVEVAWRALLKRHHPDVAGGDADADERAKRINVAHDWLSDPELRDRYDRERLGRDGSSAARTRGRGADGRWAPHRG